MTQPNVVFILIDDMGWKDITCMGSSFYETPNIDRLASEGILFTDAHAACPVCSPTRASIMSGKYPARLGLTHFINHSNPDHPKGLIEQGKLLGVPYVPYLSTEEKSLATTFKQNGYDTWHIGKWHLGSKEYWPKKHGFDVNIGGCSFGHPAGSGGYFAPWNIPTIENKENDEYLTDRLGDEAVELIKNSGDKPFFLNMCFYSVHTPLQAKTDKIEKYQAKAKKLGLDKISPFQEGEHYPTNAKKHLRIKRRLLQSDPIYAAMIEHLDENVGKILDALDAKNISDNTIVIFTSDNGGLSSSEGSPTCNAPLAEGKGWIYEGGTREPMLLRWPKKVKAGSKTDAIISSVDFYPTLLEACDLPLEPQQHVDGVSFMPVINGDRFDRGSIFWHFPHYGNQGGSPGCSMRKGEWKLIEFFGNEIKLFNLKNDISEEHNLAGQYPELVATLLQELHDWQAEANAIIPKANRDWKPWHDKELNPLD